MRLSVNLKHNRAKGLSYFSRFFSSQVLSLLIFIISTAGSYAAEKNPRVEAGDQVSVDFTCRLKDGEVVMTTDKVVADDKNVLKAGIFIPFREYAPVELKAGSGKKGPDYGKLKTMENEILESLSLDIVGMKESERKHFEIISGTLPDLKKEERFLRLSGIRKQPKSIKISTETYRKNYGKIPAPGDVIVSEEFKGLSMKVDSVADDEVQISIIMKEGMKMDLPLGKGTVHDAGDHYETIPDIKKGKIIRSGPVVGRVVDVDGGMLTIDYGHPFGYESLQCDVKVGKIIKK